MKPLSATTRLTGSRKTTSSAMTKITVAIAALLGRLLALRLALVGRRLAAGAPAGLDLPGGVAAMLGPALALRLGHGSPKSLRPLRSCGGCGPGCRRGSP